MDENTVDNEKLDQPADNVEDVEMGNDPEIILSDEDDSQDDSEEVLSDNYDEFDEDDDGEESEDSENSKEPEETGSAEKSEDSEKSEAQPSDNKSAGDNSDGKNQLTDRQKIIQEIAKEVEEQDIPTTAAYRKAAISEARKAVCKELNIAEDDFNSFDEEHQFLFSEKLEEIRAQKKQKFDAVVDRIQKKHAESARVAKIQNLIESQCDTQEKKNNLYNIIRGASTGYTEDMKAELLQGKTDKLQKLINVATGKKTLPNPKKSSSKNTKTGRDRGYASDLVFGF